MLKINANLSIPLFSILSNLAWATTPPHSDQPKWQVSAYVGAAETTINAGTLQGFGETDSLNPKNPRHQQTNVTWGFGTAYRLPPATFALQLLQEISIGPDFMYFQTNQKGDTWLFEQSIYNNYNYQLPITSLRLLADTEWTFQPLLRSYLFPFIEGGIGFARNTARYEDYPLIANTSGLSIDSHTQYQFSYTVGGGVKWLLPYHTELSFRYLYADLGNATTSTHASVTLAAPITIRLTTQTWLAGLTYLF